MSAMLAGSARGCQTPSANATWGDEAVRGMEGEGYRLPMPQATLASEYNDRSRCIFASSTFRCLHRLYAEAAFHHTLTDIEKPKVNVRIKIEIGKSSFRTRAIPKIDKAA